MGLPVGVSGAAFRQRSWMCCSSTSQSHQATLGKAGTGTRGCRAANVTRHPPLQAWRTAAELRSSAPQPCPSPSGAPHPCPAPAEPGAAAARPGGQPAPSGACSALSCARCQAYRAVSRQPSVLHCPRGSSKFRQDETNGCCKMTQHVCASPLSICLTLIHRSR